MADQQLDILIKFGLDAQAARQAAAELNQLKSASVSAGAADAAAQTAATAATEKNFASKKEVKGALKGLMYEFPVLSRIATLALNPIVLAAAGIGTAFKIWKYRIEETTRALGAVELPDVGESEIARIDRLGETYAQLAAQLAATAGAAKEVKGKVDAATNLIEFTAEFRKLLGGAGGGEGDKARVQADAAAELRARGLALLARSGRVMTPEHEAAAGADRKKFAEAAAAAKAESWQWIQDIAEYQAGEMPWYRKMLFGPKFAARYGPSRDPADRQLARAAETERAAYAGFQGTIDSYGRFKAAGIDRAERRGMAESGRQLLDQSEAFMRQSGESRRAGLLGDARGSIARMGALQDRAAQGFADAAAAAPAMVNEMRAFAAAVVAVQRELAELRRQVQQPKP